MTRDGHGHGCLTARRSRVHVLLGTREAQAKEKVNAFDLVLLSTQCMMMDGRLRLTTALEVAR